MIYADWGYYVEEFGGDVIQDAETYNACAIKASRYIDRLTMNRAESYAQLKPNDTALKKACCAAAETYLMIANAKAAAASEDGEIASESVGSHSVSYRSGLETAATLEAELNSTVSAYLVLTGLLYRGVSNVHASYSYTDFS